MTTSSPFRRVAGALAASAIIAVGCGYATVAESAPTVSDQLAAAVPATAVDSSSTSTTVPPEPPLQWTPLDEPGVGGRVTDLAIDPANTQHLLVGGDLIGVGVSTDGGTTWGVTTGLTNPEVGRFTFDPTDPTHVWVGTMGGPFLSTDGGVSWQEMRTGMPAIDAGNYSAPVDEILIDPADHTHLLATGGSHREWESPGPTAFGAIWESHDGGANWARLSTVGDDVNVVDGVWADDGTVLVATLDQGVWRSGDGGRTWSRSSDGLPADTRALVTSAARPGVFWAAVGSGRQGDDVAPGGVWRSEDGGHTWVPSSTGLAQGTTQEGSALHTARYNALAISFSDPDVLMTANLGFGTEGVFRSVDGGLTWTAVLGQGGTAPTTAYSTPPGAETLAIDPVNPGRALIGGSEYVLGTLDAGATWKDLSSDVAPTGGFVGRGYSGLVADRVVFDPANPANVLLCGFDGANPWVSTDGAASWKRPLLSWDSWGGCHDASPAADGTWWVLLGQAGTFNGVALIDPRTGVASPQAGGSLPERWTYVGELGGIEALQAADGTPVILLSVGGVLRRSVDNGTSWTQISGPEDTIDVDSDPAQPGVAYVSAADGVWRSTDGGARFSLLEGSPKGVTRLTTTGGSLYAAAYNQGDAGLHRLGADGTWTRVLDDPLVADVVADPAAPTHLIAVINDHPYHDRVASVGVLRSFDDGATWAPSSDGLPLTRVSTIAVDPAGGRVLIGTFGRGYFQATLPGS